MARLDERYVHLDVTDVPFCRICLKNRPGSISPDEELQLLSDAFGKVHTGKVLVECDSPISLSPKCLANIKFIDQIRNVWIQAGKPDVTFLTPPHILRPILHTLELPYTLM